MTQHSFYDCDGTRSGDVTMPIPLLDSEGLFGIVANHQLYLQTFGFFELNFKKSAEPSHEPTTFLYPIKNVM